MFHHSFTRLTGAILLTLLCSCGMPPQPSRVDTTHLVGDINYTTQWSELSRASGDAFAPGWSRQNGKDYPSLVQSKPGGITFYFWFRRPAEVRFSTFFEERQPSEIEASVLVESDYPKRLSREYRVTPGKEQALDLGEFVNRPLAITLQARSLNHERLGGILHWMDPLIREQAPAASNPEAFREFRERNSGKNVLIILLDAGNRFHFGFGGYNRNTTPNLDRLARESVIFDNAVTPAVYTLASSGSLFTGMYPQVHGVFEKTSALQENFKTMAEAFREGGWDTALFSANPNVSAATGYDQGFGTVWDSGTRHRVNADEISGAVIDWLNTVHGKRFFGYAHFREPHAPYVPPQPFLLKFGGDPALTLPALDEMPEPDAEMKRKAIAAYDANLAYADQEAAKILRRLQELGLERNTIVIVLADHGEAFWEHGKQGHNSQVYEEMIRIPYLLRFPGEASLRGVRRTALVSTIDLFPTLADLFQLTRKGLRPDGVSLLPQLVLGINGPSRFLISHNSMLSSYSLRTSDVKYVYSGQGRSRDELFLLREDPGEKVNAIAKYPATAATMRMLLARKLDALSREGRELRKGAERKAVIDEEMQEQLRALGYVN